MHDNQLLFQRLNQPGFHSGTQLGEVLGVSRVAIQKRIHSLMDLGLLIQAVQSKGYRLAEGVSLLDEPLLQHYLRDLSPLDSVEVLLETDSTNSHLAQQGILQDKARVCLTEVQHKGRGRRGNEWVAAPFRNILMSISWGFAQWPETISSLSLAVSLVIAERLNELYPFKVGIKWPNDLLVEQQKLAGILIDVSGEAGGQCNVTVGLGMNIWQQQEQPFDAEYDWVSFNELGENVERNELTALIIKDIVSLLESYPERGFMPYQQRWQALSCFHDQRIRIISELDTKVGVMKGVDTAGALLLLDDHGNEHRIADSMVSVRLA